MRLDVTDATQRAQRAVSKLVRALDGQRQQHANILSVFTPSVVLHGGRRSPSATSVAA